MMNILVTGGNGQLAKCIRNLTDKLPKANFIFVSRLELDITNTLAVTSFFQKNKVQYCINCAAYTAVDLAESDKENAFSVNVIGAKNLAVACNNIGATLIHISTDFVFDGTKTEPYTESDNPNPLSVYGKSKLQGEKQIQTILTNYFIIRTSWLYSEHGNNFVKTMLRLSQDRDELNVVCDQIGTPTYAKDLADALLQIISLDNSAFGIYNYSNEGVASWYDFAKAVFEIKGNYIKVNPIDSSSFPTSARRPQFSVLDKTKIKKTFHLEIPYWKNSLKRAISNI
jgi:dTDP-4-dehydrorhamnose reductase